MKELPTTGIYFCNYSNGYRDPVDFDDLAGYTSQIPGVIPLGNYTENPPVNRESFRKSIEEKRIRNLVVAGYDAGVVRPFFAGIFNEAGMDPKNIRIASFNDQGILESRDQDLARGVVFCALMDVPVEMALIPETHETNKETLVIGGGIAGIQASLEIANSDNKVFLLERTGTIGGHMAMFDKTFPTLDCAACILTPKMVEVGQHPNIELLTYSKLIGISGNPGNYKARILKKARRVDLATCIGCGICSEKCPSKVPSEFDEGTTLRKAIYIPFPQAVPNKYLIDEEHCTYVQKGKCGVCARVCPAECINLDEKDEEVEIEVGNILLATGFRTFDASRAENLGYGKYPSVLTSLEFERLINASGPTGGQITYRTEDKKGNKIFTKDNGTPRSIGIIHCVGSRDINHNPYCSRVCCMYSLKLAHLVKEKLPQAEVFEYFIDMRAFGKGYEEFYQRIKNEGVHIIRGRTAKVEGRNGKLLLRSEDMISDRLLEQEIDMVILSVGLEPDPESAMLAEMLGITVDENGWFTEANYQNEPVNTHAGITIAGVCQGPKDIPDTVAQASAAASRVIKNIMTAKTRDSLRTLRLEQIEQKVKELSLIWEE